MSTCDEALRGIGGQLEHSSPNRVVKDATAQQTVMHSCDSARGSGCEVWDSSREIFDLNVQVVL